jgi:hypothetical protein
MGPSVLVTGEIGAGWQLAVVRGVERRFLPSCVLRVTCGVAVPVPFFGPVTAADGERALL